MDDKPPTTPRGWESLPDEKLPRPNYFPAGMAMGTAIIFWGFITSLVVFLTGLGLFIAALAGWITEIRHERESR